MALLNADIDSLHEIQFLLWEIAVEEMRATCSAPLRLESLET